jgi:hypothetical protein
MRLWGNEPAGEHTFFYGKGMRIMTYVKGKGKAIPVTDREGP